MQGAGDFRHGDLVELLTTADRERVTGSLQLHQDGSETPTVMYFLFGHLLHADGGSRQGEEAVLDALEWSRGRFVFNPRAMLTPDQTIRARTRDLLTAAGYALPADEEADSKPKRTLNLWLLGPQPSEPQRR